MANRNVFISYRRGGDSHAAGRLYDRLERIFGGDRLFYDVDSIPPGVDFHDHLDQQVAACDAFLVVIGPGWLAAADRLHDEDDFVRIEIASALERERIRIIPVLLQGARMPNRADLPEALHALARRNSVTVPDEHFSTVVDGRIAAAIREALGDVAHSTAPDTSRGVPTSAPPRPPGASDDIEAWPDHTGPVSHARVPAPVFARESLKLTDLGSDVRGVAFSPDGTRLAIASQDWAARIIDAATGVDITRLPGHQGGLRSLAFSPDGLCLATGSEDRSVRLWDIDTGVEVARFEGHGNQITSVAFSPDGTLLAAGSLSQVARVWEVSSRAEILKARHGAQVNCVAFDPGGTILATGSDDGTARTWDIAAYRQLAVLEGGGKGVAGVSFSPDGTHLATASRDGLVRLWDASTGVLGRRFGDGKSLNSIAYTPDGSYLATGGSDATVRLWDAAAGTEAARFQVGKSWWHGSNAFAVAFSPDGARLAAGDAQGALRVWDLSTG